MMDLKKNRIKTPFTVPQGYFEELEDRLWTLMKIEGMTGLRNISPEPAYFDELEEQILSGIELEKAGIKDRIPETPENYFEKLEDNILSSIKVDGLLKETVDSKYLDDLEERVLNLVTLECKIGKTQLAVTPGYFDRLEEEILNKTLAEEKPKFKILRNLEWYRNAAAILLVSGLVALFALFNTADTKDDLASISTTDLITYLSEQQLNTEDLLFIVDDGQADYLLWDENFSYDEISAYLLENGLEI